MRQLARERAKAKEQQKNFQYKNLKKVYTIVLMEKSPSEYWDFPENYIHHSKQVFDTGLKLDLLQEYYMVPLDIFKEMSHNVLNKLEAWRYFVGSDSPKDISRVIEAFPEFKEMYGELLMLRYRTEELVSMFDVIREALRAADEGTVKYMVEEQQKEIEKQQKEIEEQQKEIEEHQKEIEQQKKENERLRKLLKQANIEAE